MTDASDDDRYDAAKPWLEIDLLDLKELLQAGDTIEQVAKHLLRNEAEVCGKMREIGLRVKGSRPAAGAGPGARNSN